MLFIDARKLGALVDRTRRELSDSEIQKIADTYHVWRGEPNLSAYADVPGFCKSATLNEIQQHGYTLTPGRFVGATEAEIDDLTFEDRFSLLREALNTQFDEAAELRERIKQAITRVNTK